MLGYHTPDSLDPEMQDTGSTTETSRLPPHWTGLRATREAMEVSLVDADGRTLESVHMPNDMRNVLRVVKHWVRLHGFDPVKAVFCVEDRSPWLGPVLERLLARGWDVVLITAHRSFEDQAEAPTVLGVDDMVRYAMRDQVTKEPLSLAHLRAGKVERLRERRAELAALRSGLQTDGGGRNRYFGEELQREFERMDRRHMQLLDKLLSRLDTLINLQLHDSYQREQL